jgi:hypothetical protein
MTSLLDIYRTANLVKEYGTDEAPPIARKAC